MSHLSYFLRYCCVFAILLSSCASSPEEVVLEGVRAMCNKDIETLRGLVTEDSMWLFQGMFGAVPEIVACTAGELEVVGVRALEEDGGLVRVTLFAAGRLESVLVHRREGTWKIDLFMVGWDDTLGMNELERQGGGRQ